ncbi:MAG: FMN-binding negative transcriptional regulator [Pseudomonadota bacterium]|nr:FMN-binding negative transcriptional regulator [Burkholderiaceae bacterium]MDQ3447532.1 FMN-binding negative transcriptional regulator [Pseudomonadota bacterium]
MYVPSHFAESSVDVLHDLIRTHPFGALIVLASGGLDANHIPFEIDPEPAPFGTLRGHVARANPVWRDFSAQVDALVLFQGAHAYISPAWYATKKEHGKVVPTWNYAVVHAHGPLRVIDDRAWLRQFVGKLTDRHEATRSDPWKVTDAPAEFIDTMVAAIVGIEIPIAKLTGKWKVSQNRPEKDRAGVVEGLVHPPSDLATSMAQLVSERG